MSSSVIVMAQSQKTRETEDTFADNLQVLATKIIVQKTFLQEGGQAAAEGPICA